MRPEADAGWPSQLSRLFYVHVVNGNHLHRPPALRDCACNRGAGDSKLRSIRTRHAGARREREGRAPEGRICVIAPRHHSHTALPSPPSCNPKRSKHSAQVYQGKTTQIQQRNHKNHNLSPLPRRVTLQFIPPPRCVSSRLEGRHIQKKPLET